MQTSKDTSLFARFPLFSDGLLLAFLGARLLLWLALPLEGLRGYGDLSQFYNLTSLPGWPYFHFWVEFPPLFPWLSKIIYFLADAREHVYDYLLVFLLLLADTGSLVYFRRIARRLYGEQEGHGRAVGYAVLIGGLAYSWWYFDPLAVFFMVWGMWLLLEGRYIRGGGVIAVGALVKFFPGLALLAAWRGPQRWKKLIVGGFILLAVLGLVFGMLGLVSPGYTAAGLSAQGSKGSWETVWALLDGNYKTGNFGPLVERLDPQKAYLALGNPARVPAWLSLILFGGLGLWAMLRLKPETDRQTLALLGLALCLLFLWSPGWSVQWILYLLPFLALVLPGRQAVLLSATLVLVNVLEWPLLLSRGLFDLLPLTIGLRTVLLLAAAVLFYQIGRQPNKAQDAGL